MNLILLIALLVTQGSSHSTEKDLIFSDWQPGAAELESSIQLPVSQDRKSQLERQLQCENPNLIARALLRLGIVVPAIFAYLKVFSFIFLSCTENTATTTVTSSDITTVTDLSTTTALVTTTEIFIILTSAFVRAPVLVTKLVPCIGKRQRLMTVNNQFLQGSMKAIEAVDGSGTDFQDDQELDLFDSTNTESWILPSAVEKSPSNTHTEDKLLD